MIKTRKKLLPTQKEIEISNRLRELRIQNLLTLKQAAEQIGISNVTLFRYETLDITNIPIDRIQKMADVYKTTPAFIMGWEKGQQDKLKYIPVVGKINCGTPYLAENNIVTRIRIELSKDVDFALVAQGDSMIGSGILEGDVILIKQQHTVENGEIAVILIGDEATLKKFYQEKNKISLVATNPDYPPMIFNKTEARDIRIIGRAIYVIHDLTSKIKNI